MLRMDGWQVDKVLRMDGRLTVLRMDGWQVDKVLRMDGRLTKCYVWMVG